MVQAPLIHISHFVWEFIKECNGMKQVNHKGIVMNVMEWKKKLIKLNQIILFRCFKINE